MRIPSCAIGVLVGTLSTSFAFRSHTLTSSTSNHFQQTLRTRIRNHDTHLHSTKERAGVSGLTQQMREMQSQIMSENEDAKLIMQALRGKNINDDDRQVQGLEMKLIEFDDVDGVGDAVNGVNGGGDDRLPYDYDPVALEKFFSKRPQLIVARVVQVLSTGGNVLFNFAFDSLTGKFEKDPEWEVKRAGELRDTITSLGPFFIKLGQVRKYATTLISSLALSPRNEVSMML